MSAKKKTSKLSASPKTNDNVVVLTELTLGVDDFQSDGWSYVKVTRQGQAQILQVPIRSAGVTELIEAMSRQRPQAPDKRTLVAQDSTEGRELGLSKDKWIISANVNDPAYQSKIQRWNLDLTFGIVLAALNLPIKNSDGDVVFDPTDRNLSPKAKDIAIDAMKGLGFTMDHFTQIAQDAQKLTEFSEEEKSDFFGESSDSQTENGDS